MKTSNSTGRPAAKIRYELRSAADDEIVYEARVPAHK